MLRASITIILAGVLLWAGCLAVDSRHGMVLGAQAAQATGYTEHPDRTAAERKAIKLWRSRIGRVAGWRVGRWYDECDKYWPTRQLDTCLLVIANESGGLPYAHNGPYHGLFQQDTRGVSVNLFRWYNAIRRAYLLYRTRGWGAWPWLGD